MVDARIFRWNCNVRFEDKTPIEELRIKLKLNSLTESLQDKKLQQFGHLETLKESAWSSKCRTFKISDNFP